MSLGEGEMDDPSVQGPPVYKMWMYQEPQVGVVRPAFHWRSSTKCLGITNAYNQTKYKVRSSSTSLIFLGQPRLGTFASFIIAFVAFDTLLLDY